MGAKRQKIKKTLLVSLSIIVLLAAAVVISVQRSPSSDASQPMTITALSGTIQSATIKINMPRQVDDASFAATNGLTDLIKPAQTGKQTVRAGTISLQAFVTVASNKASGNYGGVVEVRDRNGKRVASSAVTVVVREPSASFVPASFAQPTPDHIATVGDESMPYIKDELLVRISSNISDPQRRIKEIAQQTHGGIFGTLADKHTFQLRYPVAAIDDLAKIRNDLIWTLGVDAAAFDPLGQTLAIPNDKGFADPTKPGKRDPWDDSNRETRTWGQRYIGLPQAWDKTTGNKQVKIGIIDSGFDAEHPDLKGNVDLLNSIEIDSAKTRERVENGSPHGTAVAGPACAEGNNTIGIAGVMWHCALYFYDASLLYLPVDLEQLGFPKGYRFTASAAADEMTRAVHDGMRAVNMSIGWGGSENFCNKQLDTYTKMLINSANDNISGPIKEAKNAKQDILWVFAAGNSCHDINEVAPAALVRQFPDNTMAVAAIAENEDMQQDATLQERSNWGTDISVAAPGEKIYSTNAKAPTEPDSALYKLRGGTSLAAPFVTGLAGLVLSKHNDFTAKQVKQCIVDTAKRSGHKVQSYNFSVINAPKTLDCQPDPDPDSPMGTNQQCVFNMTLLPVRCESTNPTVKVEFTNVGNRCDYESRLSWEDSKDPQIDTLKGIDIQKTVPLGTHSFTQPGQHIIIDDFSGPCVILEQEYEFTLLPKH